MLPLLRAELDIIGSFSSSKGPLKEDRYLLAKEKATTSNTATGTQDEMLRNILKPFFTSSVVVQLLSIEELTTAIKDRVVRSTTSDMYIQP